MSFSLLPPSANHFQANEISKAYRIRSGGSSNVLYSFTAQLIGDFPEGQEYASFLRDKEKTGKHSAWEDIMLSIHMNEKEAVESVYNYSTTSIKGTVEEIVSEDLPTNHQS